MTPDQLRELRESLPALSDPDEDTALRREFCRFYGIDFHNRLPALEYRLGTVPSGAYTLAVHRWLQADASMNLVLVHGYYDHSGLFGKLVEYGLLRNFNVLIFDLPGHGLSSGEPAVIDDFAEYGKAVAAVLATVQLPDLPRWVMAQSTGCAALVEYARHYRWPFVATVLLAPLVRPHGWGLGRVAHSVLRPFTDSINRKFVTNSSDREFLEFQQRDPLQSRRLSLRWVTALRRWLASLPAKDLGVGRALIVQGDGDQTVDWRYNIEVYREWFPASQVKLLAGAGHQLANESSALRREYLDSVDAWLAALGPPDSRPRPSVVAPLSGP